MATKVIVMEQRGRRGKVACLLLVQRDNEDNDDNEDNEDKARAKARAKPKSQSQKPKHAVATLGNLPRSWKPKCIACSPF